MDAMQSNQRRLMREAGTAFAVLAIYVLTLLLPLHHAAGLQRDFNALGYSNLSAWSVCAALAEDDTEQPAAALTCPANGVGKQQVAVLPPPILLIEAPGVADLVSFAPDTNLRTAVRPDHVGQSRAPPLKA
jgi:hypothetical protein